MDWKYFSNSGHESFSSLLLVCGTYVHFWNKNESKAILMLSLRRIPTFESKVENNLSSSEKDSNLLPLLGESYKFVSTFGIKMSQNWKSHSYVKSMGNYIFLVKTGK